MTKAEKTRQFIIEKSAPIFNTKGLLPTAMSDIMAATKLSKGSLYVHFQDKDDLSLAAVDYNLGKLVNKIAQDVSNQTTAKAKLMACFDHLNDPVKSAVAGGCPMLNFGMEADDTNPAVLKKIGKTVKTLQQNIVSIIERGIASGEFKKSFDSKNLLQKLLQWWKAV